MSERLAGYLSELATGNRTIQHDLVQLVYFVCQMHSDYNDCYGQQDVTRK